MRKLVILSLALILILLPVSSVLADSYSYSIPVYTGWFEIHYPSAAGYNATWTGTYIDIDDDWKDYNDADYITTSTANAFSSFQFDDWSGTATINQVMVVVRGKKIYAADDLELYYRESGQNYNQGSLSPAGSFSELSKTFPTNPATGASWNTTSISAMEWGVEKIGSAGAVYVSQMYVKVVPATIDGAASKTNFSIITDLDVQDLADDGYISASALDTMLYSSDAYMLTSNKIVYFISSLSAYETKKNDLYLNYSPAQTDFNFVAGNNGYVTISDNATIELSDNFTIEQKGWIDTSVVSGNLTNKQDAFRIYTNGSNNITSEVKATGSTSYDPTANGSINENDKIGGVATSWQTVSDNNDNTYMQCIHGDALNETDLYVNPAIFTDRTGTDTITSVEVFWRAKEDTDPAVGEAQLYIGAAEYSGGHEQYTLAWAWYSKEWVQNPATAADWLVADLNGIEFGFNQHEEGVGVMANTSECYITINYVSLVEVTATGVVSGEHIVMTTANVTYLAIFIDGVEKDAAALSGASVPNNANNWLLNQSNTMPYMDYMKISIDGTQQLWYQPNTLISGTTLPDRTGSNNGVITWGTSPCGITTWVGAMSITDTYTSSAAEPGDVPGMTVSPPDAGTGMVPGSAGVEEIATTLPFYYLFNEAAVAMGMATSAMYMVAIISMSVGIGFLFYIALGSVVVGIAAVAAGIGGGVTTGLVPLWFLIVFLISSIALVYVGKRL